MKKLFFIFFIIVLVMAGCGKKEKIDEKEMSRLGSALTKLSSAVESTVRYKKPPKGISDADLLKLATQHDPKLLEPFSKYTLKVQQENRHGIVLVCDKKGKRGLLEDAGCSRAMDANLWRSKASCKFTLNADSVCR
ncbi:hypothetical protein Dvar_73370 [Desulfosarcina variabilis str. Montpellier]|uniref:hypothetical protein n=1 Tax=Desulfosarcina variabilis TaxID=2300 RepID=UPI003AFAF301